MKALATALVLLVVCPAAAAGSSVRLERGQMCAHHYGCSPEDELIYEAAPGETNVVSLEERGTGIAVHDTVSITPGALCEATSDPRTVVCDPAYVSGTDFDLGDGDDRVDQTLRNAITNVDGGPGDDVIDATKGGGGMLRGGEGDDDIRASDGMSTMVGGPGADRIIGGASNADFVSYADHTAPVSLTQDGIANDGAAGEGDNVVGGIEEVEGGDGSDHLIGTAGIDSIVGGNGDDSIDGGPGQDTLEGGGGADTIDGGADDDVIVGYTSNLLGHLSEVPPTADRPATLMGGSGDDRLRGGPATDDIDPGEGADLVEGSGGGDSVHARDASLDRVTCSHEGAVGTAELDQRDLARRCASVDRVGIAAPRFLLVGQADIDPDGIIHVAIGCSQDQTAGCGGTLRLRRPNGRLLAKKRVSIGPGRSRLMKPRIALPRVFGSPSCRGLRVTISYSTHDAAGKRRVITTHLLVTSIAHNCNTPTMLEPLSDGW